MKVIEVLTALNKKMRQYSFLFLSEALGCEDERILNFIEKETFYERDYKRGSGKGSE